MSKAEATHLEYIPDGVDLESLHEAVREDLVDGQGLADLLGSRHVDGQIVSKTSVPRIRPILVALAARAAGASNVDPDTQYLSEILHLALAFHDFTLGREGGRRRRMARRLARSMTWMGGHHLTLRAMEIGRNVQPQLMDDIVDTLRAFSDAQALSRELREGPVMPTLEDWSEHADGHTSALFGFCCRSGGMLAMTSSTQLRSLGRYGRHLGRLWHIAEDVSVLSGSERGVGLALRAAAGRPVLPVVLAVRANPQLAAQWLALCGDPSDEAGEALAHAVVEGGGIKDAREVMAREAWRAQQALTGLRESSYRSHLDRLARTLARPVASDASSE
jgi:geranylgeranyl pyrophosphate synthase